jgi:choline-sulfatase
MRLFIPLILLLSLVRFPVWAETPPNILFILTDDQGAWAMGNENNPDADTPGMDRLAAEGAKFTNFFVTTPVCSPSRVGLLTSRYGSEVGITDWISPRKRPDTLDESQLGLDPSLPTWVRDLRDAGYNTGLVGKWHLGTQDAFLPANFGYDFFYGFREGGAKVYEPVLEHNGVIAQEKGLTSDLVTDKALAFIQSAAEKNAPFILSLHYREPHAPWTPVADADERHVNARSLTLPKPGIPNLDHERMERSMREYLASVASADRNLRRILRLLDESGLDKNTIVIFTSDHGYNIGHHGVLHKGNATWLTKDGEPSGRRPNMWDTSLRVPVLVRWPGVVAPGSLIEECVTNLDWYPTLLAMAGLAPKEGDLIHGRNFLPLLKGESIPWDNDFYGEYAMHHGANTDMRMYRTPEWKLIRDFGRPGMDELYDLKNDPGETKNLIDDPARTAVREALSEKLNARHAAIAATALKGN